jgi:glyoxalase-like protein
MTESNRRDWLRLCAAAGASAMFVSRSSAAERLTPAVSAADHLLLGVSDLDLGIAWVRKRTGVKAAVGGSHPGVGTRNALLSLGGRRYLEIIAPDPAQSDFKFRIDVRRLSEPRLINWAAASKDVDALSKKALEAGFEVFGPQPGSRARPDGKVLRWKTFGVMNGFGADDVEPVPFFIEWAADSVHPSQDSPKGCELLALELAHPKASDVHDVLAKLGIEAKVKTRDRSILVATLRTPKGTLKLT